MINSSKAIDKLYIIFAGKFRRYHGSFLKSVDVQTIFHNVKDIYKLILGTFEAIAILRREKPSGIFIKGGFVGVPVGIAAALLKVPYITHDTDSTPGLANRLISRWAKIHAVANPKAAQTFKDGRCVVTGPIISSEYKVVSQDQQRLYKKELFGDQSVKVIFVTGGGLGAERVNNLVLGVASDLLEDPSVILVHQTGLGKGEMAKAHYSTMEKEKQKRLYLKDFLPDLYKYSGAADVIVSRSGATSLAEFAAQTKACVIIPNQALRWDLLNAKDLRELQAAVVIEEKLLEADPSLLTDAIFRLLKDNKLRQELGSSLNATYVEGATDKITDLLLKSS